MMKALGFTNWEDLIKAADESSSNDALVKGAPESSGDNDANIEAAAGEQTMMEDVEEIHATPGCYEPVAATDDAFEEDDEEMLSAQEDVKSMDKFIDVTSLFPPLPKKGQFDVSNIKNSLYFFS